MCARKSSSSRYIHIHCMHCEQANSILFALHSVAEREGLAGQKGADKRCGALHDAQPNQSVSKEPHRPALPSIQRCTGAVRMGPGVVPSQARSCAAAGQGRGGLVGVVSVSMKGACTAS